MNVFDYFMELALKGLKSQTLLEKKNANDTNIYALGILDRYENRLDDLNVLCLADFVSSYISKKAVDIAVEFVDLNNYILSVTDFWGTPLCKKVIKLKNGLG